MTTTTRSPIETSESLDPDSGLPDDLVIRVKDLGKLYHIYDNPTDRLKQALWRGRRQFFREFWALRDVSFEVKRGEALGIIGRNGSGKSTLLQMICGTLTPTEGTVETRGRIAALLELGSGFNPEFTGMENVFLNASLLGLTKEETEARLDDILAFADIGDFVSQPVKTYSSGMLVRLAFAVLAHTEPEVLIVDEALSVGDAVFSQRCFRFVRSIADHACLLFVSHDMNAIANLCNNGIWLDRGHLHLKADSEPLLQAYTRHCYETSLAESQSLGTATLSNSPTSITHDHSGYEQPSEGEARTALGVKSDIVSSWDHKKDYGNRRALITNVEIRGHDDKPTLNPVCGEKVTLIIQAICQEEIKNFMAGYVVRNRTGMIIWGENTIHLGYYIVAPGQSIRLSFEFIMPYLEPGGYSLSAAISEGDEFSPLVLHYKPDLMLIEPMLNGRIVHGAIAVVSTNIKASIEE
jgi:lipopolysaccharide transport system ATP-binding protein